MIPIIKPRMTAIASIRGTLGKTWSGYDGRISIRTFAPLFASTIYLSIARSFEVIISVVELKSVKRLLMIFISSFALETYSLVSVLFI